MQNKNKAIIFDMDGVLIDNKHLHKKAWVDFCRQHDCPITEEYFEETGFGKDNKDYLTIFFEREVTEEEVHQYGEKKEQIYRDLAKNELYPVKGLATLLKQIKEQGDFKTAIASSSPISNIQFTLDTLKLNGYFDLLTDGNSVKNGKPSPEIYLKTADKLNISPEKCIVFEDSLFGVESAVRAEMKVVALTTSHTEMELSVYNTQKIIDDFTEISFGELKELV